MAREPNSSLIIPDDGRKPLESAACLTRRQVVRLRSSAAPGSLGIQFCSRKGQPLVGELNLGILTPLRGCIDHRPAISSPQCYSEQILRHNPVEYFARLT